MKQKIAFSFGADGTGEEFYDTTKILPNMRGFCLARKTVSLCQVPPKFLVTCVLQQLEQRVNLRDVILMKDRLKSWMIRTNKQDLVEVPENRKLILNKDVNPLRIH